MKFIKCTKNSMLGFFFNDQALDYIDENVSWKYTFFLSWVFFSVLSIAYIGISFFVSTVAISDFYVLLGSIVFYPLILFSLLWLSDLMLSLFGGIGRLVTLIKFTAAMALFPMLIVFIVKIILLFLPQNLWDAISYIVLTTFYFWSLILILKVCSILYNMSKVSVFSSIIILLFVLLVLFAIGFMLVLYILNGFTFELEQSTVIESVDLIKLEPSSIYLMSNETRTVYLSSVEVINSTCNIRETINLVEGLNIFDLNCETPLETGSIYDVTLRSETARSIFSIRVLES